MDIALFGYHAPPTDALREHARALYERRHEAAPVPRRGVGDETWQPAVNLCHENVQQWCGLHPDHEIVRGWLYFALPGLAYCRFVSHSVIRQPDGMLIDITPTGPLAQADPYPFVPAGVSEDDYADLAAELYGGTGRGDLDWQHAAG
jgi:hypothetical protein